MAHLCESIVASSLNLNVVNVRELWVSVSGGREIGETHDWIQIGNSDWSIKPRLTLKYSSLWALTG